MQAVDLAEQDQIIAAALQKLAEVLPHGLGAPQLGLPGPIIVGLHHAAVGFKSLLHENIGGAGHIEHPHQQHFPGATGHRCSRARRRCAQPVALYGTQHICQGNFRHAAPVGARVPALGILTRAAGQLLTKDCDLPANRLVLGNSGGPEQHISRNAHRRCDMGRTAVRGNHQPALRQELRGLLNGQSSLHIDQRCGPAFGLELLALMLAAE